MARERRGGRQEPPVKGFRPGREPQHLRRQPQMQPRMSELNPAQQRLVQALQGKTPEEARAMMARWRNGTLATAVALVVVAMLLFRWSALAGVGVAVMAAVAFAVWLRLRKQRAEIEALAEMVGKRTRR